MQINTLVVDDSSVMRLLIKDILEQDSNIKVIDTATNGKEALDKTRRLNPDIVVMDMVMGHYDGLYGVKQIMSAHPTPILLLSSLGNTDMTPIMEALNAGAFDYINKPANRSTRLRDIGQDIIRKVKQGCRVDITKLKDTKKVSENTHTHTFSDDMPYDIVVIGASTGGPTAVEKVLSKLPGNMAVPVVVTQHMPSNFVPSFAQRLNKITPLNVVVGTAGMRLQPKTVIIAPGDKNMIIRRDEHNIPVVAFTSKNYPEYNHPSINAVMESVAEVYGKKSLGVILTGMGRDGAAGLGNIKDAGGFTIAQDEETSVVFGMPKEAIKSGKVDRTVPIQEIGSFIVSCLS